MMHMDMMNNDSEHKLFNSESLPTIQYYQHFGYVWANIEKFWSQHNFWENPWICLCHFAQQDVAKSVCLHNGTSPQAGQQKGVLLSSFFQFFPCLTFSSKYCLQRVRTLTYRSTVLTKCLGGGMKSNNYLLSFPVRSPIPWVACLVKKDLHWAYKIGSWSHFSAILLSGKCLRTFGWIFLFWTS